MFLVNLQDQRGKKKHGFFEICNCTWEVWFFNFAHGKISHIIIASVVVKISFLTFSTQLKSFWKKRVKALSIIQLSSVQKIFLDPFPTLYKM